MRWLLPLAIAGLLVGHSAAQAGCTVQQRASVAFTRSSGQLLVPLQVNDSAATFVLDTGAERSLVTPEAVRRLGLQLDQWVGTTMRGIGGIVEHANADPRSLRLGSVILQRHTVTHDTSLTVGVLPQANAAAPVDGLLGRDFLSPFDVQIDMAADQVTLFDVHDCSGRFLPWHGDYAAVPAEMPIGHAMIVPFSLDAHPLRALLDTGASASMLTLSGMRRLGLTEAALVGGHGQTAHGIGPQTPSMQRHRFASLAIGGVTVSNPTLWIAPVRVTPFVDALLGADWIEAQRRVWISFATSEVFFQ